MIVTHAFKIQAICPVNGDTNYYDCEVVLSGVVNCETLLSDAAEYKKDAIYQEELTSRLAERWYATVTTRGHHVGGQVATKCVAFPKSRVLPEKNRWTPAHVSDHI